MFCDTGGLTMSADGSGNDRKIQVAPPQISEGAALPDSFRFNMETAMGADFSSVRVHEGHEATMLGAQAFTRGQDIYFAPGAYQPFTEGGRHLVAHELTHTIQQNSAPLAEGLVDTNPDPSPESDG